MAAAAAIVPVVMSGVRENERRERVGEEDRSTSAAAGMSFICRMPRAESCGSDSLERSPRANGRTSPRRPSSHPASPHLSHKSARSVASPSGAEEALDSDPGCRGGEDVFEVMRVNGAAAAKHNIRCSCGAGLVLHMDLRLAGIRDEPAWRVGHKPSTASAAAASPPRDRADWQKMLWYLMESDEKETLVAGAPRWQLAARVLGCISLFLILVTVSAFIAETNPAYYLDEPPAFFIIEAVCMGWFTLELVARGVSCPNLKAWLTSFFTVIDILSILPFYIDLAVGRDQAKGLVIVRTFRLVRVFRMYKVSRGRDEIGVVATCLTDSAEGLYLLLFLVALSVMVFSSAMYFIEREGMHFNHEGQFWYLNETDPWSPYQDATTVVRSPFQSVVHTFWWCIVTLTTVGYGDETPSTPGGKVVACLTMLCGTLVMAFPMVIISQNFHDAYNKHIDSKAEALCAASDDDDKPRLQRVKSASFGSQRSSVGSHQAAVARRASMVAVGDVAPAGDDTATPEESSSVARRDAPAGAACSMNSAAAHPLKHSGQLMSFRGPGRQLKVKPSSSFQSFRLRSVRSGGGRTLAAAAAPHGDREYSVEPTFLNEATQHSPCAEVLKPADIKFDLSGTPRVIESQPSSNSPMSQSHGSVHSARFRKLPDAGVASTASPPPAGFPAALKLDASVLADSQTGSQPVSPLRPRTGRLSPSPSPSRGGGAHSPVAGRYQDVDEAVLKCCAQIEALEQRLVSVLAGLPRRASGAALSLGSGPSATLSPPSGTLQRVSVLSDASSAGARGPRRSSAGPHTDASAAEPIHDAAVLLPPPRGRRRRSLTTSPGSASLGGGGAPPSLALSPGGGGEDELSADASPKLGPNRQHTMPMPGGSISMRSPPG
eukprot:TRINITY_DN2299_c1_g1_i1.p1 TRINITY_DN2299_c1_g1~~TRINITY_DN2299_c1_g1_i1.p1  ORF type:complete len:886 (+),score=242.43 TRINITY_DN2299_c1_g1_i1:145-2802(+)